MPILYLITGPSGVGKTTISQKIAESKNKSALIEGDSIYHQVIGSYVSAWKDGNHLNLFWSICINNIKIYLENGYDVVFNYILTPANVDMIKNKFKDFPIKFVILLSDANTLLLRDAERPADCQMKDRCIVLLNKFKNGNYNSKNIIDTSTLSIEDTVKLIENNDELFI